MKTIQTLFTLMALFGCVGCATVGDFVNPRSTVPCYRAPADRDTSKDYAECSLQTLTANQHMACMNLRGYSMAVCYADNGKFADGKN